MSSVWVVLRVLLSIRTSITVVSAPGDVVKKQHGRQKPSFDATFHHRAFLDVSKLNNTPSIAYIFSFSGLGSQLMNFFAKAVYFAERENRSMIAIESHYPHYRLNETMGVFSGYFSPQFPVIDTRDQLLLLQPYFKKEQHQLNVSQFIFRYTNKKRWWMAKPWRGNQNSLPIKLVGLIDYREEIHSFYNGRSRELYHKMVRLMCPHLQFNFETQVQIDKILQDNGVSITHTGPNTGGVVSTAFHIRRGDKVATGESFAYQADEYVRKMESVLQTSGKDASAVQTCFVATDDATVISELQEILKQHDFACKLLSLVGNTTTSPTLSSRSWKTRTSPAFTLQFLAELSVLIRSTYFIGTFNSNVGALVTVLRSCGRSYDNYDDHYGRSFGVDQDDWFFF